MSKYDYDWTECDKTIDRITDCDLPDKYKVLFLIDIAIHQEKRIRQLEVITGIEASVNWDTRREG